MNRPLTASEVARFTAHMAARFHARIVRKSDAIEMKVIGAILAAVGIRDATKFLEQTATAIGPLVYLPDAATPEAQFQQVVHECQHVFQFWTGGFGFAWLYLTEPEKRVAFEVEAYLAQLEASYWCDHRLPALGTLTLPLEAGYLLGEQEVKLGEQLLEAAATRMVTTGTAGTKAGQAAREWLAANAPDLEFGR